MVQTAREAGPSSRPMASASHRLPPSISKNATSSLYRLPLPSDSKIAWTRCEIECTAEDWPEVYQLLASQSRREARLAGLRWRMRQGSDEKDKGKGKAEDPASPLLNQTLWHLELQTTREQSTAPTVKLSLDGESVEETIVGDAAPRQKYKLWTFEIESEQSSASNASILSPSQSRASKDGRHHAPTHEAAVEEGDDEDLWGDPHTPRSTSAQWQSDELRALSEVQAGRAALQSRLDGIKDASRGQTSLAEMSKGMQTNESSQTAATRSALLRSVQRRLADLLVSKAAPGGLANLNEDDSPTQRAPRSRQGGTPPHPASIDHDSMDDQGHADEEDGEILETAEDQTSNAEQAGKQPTFGMQKRKASRLTRPLVRMRENDVLLLPPDWGTESFISLTTSRIVSAQHQVYFVTPARNEPETQDSALLVRLVLRQMPFTLASSIDDGKDVMLAPHWSKARLARLMEPNEWPVTPEVSQLKRELAQTLASQTSLDEDALRESRWGMLEREARHSRDTVETFVWPLCLCFVDERASSQPTSPLLPELRPFVSASWEQLLRKTADLTASKSGFERTSTVVEKAEATPASQDDQEDGDMSAEDTTMKASDVLDKDDSQLGQSDTKSRSELPRNDGLQEGLKEEPDDRDAHEDEDDDLFGSESGNDEQPVDDSRSEIPPADLPLKSRRGSIDDGMYGLITDDDFAFFDDDAAAQAASDAEAPHREQSERKENDHQPMEVDEPGRTESRPDAISAAIQADSPTPKDGKTPATAVAMSSSSTFATDPSSVPGLTPGSLTESSPATGGPFDRTPRTPTSPYYDGTLPGPTPSQSAPFEGQVGSDEQDATMIQGHVPDAEQDAAAGFGKILRPVHARPSMKDLGDKYNLGKFALPQNTASGIAGTGRRIKATSHGLSNSLVHRQNAQTPSLKRSRKAAETRSEEGLSESGTLDGSASSLSDWDGDSDGSDDGDDDDSQDTVEEELLQISRARAAMEKYLAAARRIEARPELVYAPEAASLAKSNGSVRDDEPQRGVVQKMEPAFQQGLDTWLLGHPFLRKAFHGDRDDIVSHAAATLSAAESEGLLGLLERSECRVGDCLEDWQLLEPAPVCVGCQGSITKMAPTALRYWNKLGLSAAGGLRSVKATVLHLPSMSEGHRVELQLWMDRMQATFQMLGLGSHESAEEPLLEMGGEDPSDDIATVVKDVIADNDRRDETLKSILFRFSSATVPDHHLVVYVVGCMGPSTDWRALLSLQQELRDLAKKQMGRYAHHLHLRPLPQEAVFTSLRDSAAHLRLHAMSLYDTLRVVVDEEPIRRMHPGVLPESEPVHMPAFTLADVDDGGSQVENRSSFVIRGQNAKESDEVQTKAFARCGLLHVAYDLDEDEVQASAVLDSGRNGRVRCSQSISSLRDRLRWVWQFATSSLSLNSTDSLYGVVICKARLLDDDEVEAWRSFQTEGVFSTSPCLGVNILCRDDVTPLLVSHEKLTSAEDSERRQQHGQHSTQPGSTMVSTQKATFVSYPSVRLPCTDQRDAAACGILAVQSSVSVTMDPNNQDLLLQHSTAQRGTYTEWLHLVASYDGKLSRIGAGAGDASHERSPTMLMRCITRSLFQLRLVAEHSGAALDPTGRLSWPFAALQAVTKSSAGKAKS
ncbi:unnamed protein product [Jaminaea pallidilutea]